MPEVIEASDALESVQIVLVEPAGALNVGSVARVMKNMGLSRLVLVNPQCDRLSAEARQMAVHAADVLESAQEVATLPEALQGCQKAIATTGRDRALTAQFPLEHPAIALPWLVNDVTRAALIFGREDRGLANEELHYAQRLIRIPASEVYPSLNLAQAVAICCYELRVRGDRRFTETVELAPAGNSPSFLLDPLASLDALEGYYQQLEALLLKIGYLYPHTALSRMEKLRQFYSRAYPTTAEVAMLRGILRQMEWAIRQGRQEPLEGDRE
ncbi:RNA methyltransferase [Phormidium tenue FACHB-886]|nr:RNA methyltransferase [Phormidium tenue FACHB-886]